MGVDVGSIFGRLTVVADVGLSGHSRMWRCRCECGEEVVTRGSRLSAGTTKSCGCLRRQPIPVGTKLNRWTILGVGEPYIRPGNGQQMPRSKCRCECGTEKEVLNCSLLSNGIKSCGCLNSDVLIARNTTHGQSTREGRSITYVSWGCMMNRCRAVKGRNKEHYVDRGITVCERWHSYENFLADMGERPSLEYSIDRIDVNGNCCPENCRWATELQQLNNRTDSVKLTFYGKTMTVTEWSRISQVSSGAIRSRLKRGWPEKQAVWSPPGTKLKEHGVVAVA